jgi:tubulin polyglutamylase TTLL6/13
MEKTNQDKTKIIINVSNTQYDIVKSVSKDQGYELSYNDQDPNWDLCWQDGALSPEKFSQMEVFQKINHFPGMYTLSRKNTLAQNLNTMQKALPDDYNFFPETWVLPKDYFDLKNRAKFTVLIVKPESSCQGKGILLVRKIEDLPERCVAQRYLSRPFLIDNLKFDLRLYVLITGCDPLRIFLHQEGLVRFATEEYREPRNSLEDSFIHLTNYAINKNNPKYQQDASEGFLGHKRRFTWLLTYLDSKGYNVSGLWREISGIVIKTIMSGTPLMSHLYRATHPDDPSNSMCFEVLGFDILLDSDLKPWLLEVNHTPSFSTDSDLDYQVKKSVISHALTLLDLNTMNKQVISNSVKERLRDRNSLKMKEFKKWKEKQLAKWKFKRDLFEQQQETGFVKIYPDYRQSFAKVLEVANQIWNRNTVSKVHLDEEEECVVRVSVKKRGIVPRLRRKLEILSKSKSQSCLKKKEDQFVFKPLPVPKRVGSRIEVKQKRSLNCTGYFVPPKTISFEGEEAPEENKSFMKWKLIK